MIVVMRDRVKVLLPAATLACVAVDNLLFRELLEKLLRFWIPNIVGVQTPVYDPFESLSHRVFIFFSKPWTRCWNQHHFLDILGARSCCATDKQYGCRYSVIDIPASQGFRRNWGICLHCQKSGIALFFSEVRKIIWNLWVLFCKLH